MSSWGNLDEKVKTFGYSPIFDVGDKGRVLTQDIVQGFHKLWMHFHGL